MQQYIFEEESAEAGAPRLIPFGLKMVAPVLMAFGTPAQQQQVPAADSVERGLVVSGIFGTRRRLRSRLASYPRRTRG